MKCTKFIVFLFLFFIAKLDVKAQSLPVGIPVLEDYYRRLQLLGSTDSAVSFTVRPIFPGAVVDANFFLPNDSVKNWNIVRDKSAPSNFVILPATIQTQYNSSHPFGWNDGAMIPAKGFQTMFTTGFFVKYGPLTIQLKPEFVYAANPTFGTFSSHSSMSEITHYFNIYNNIDQPVRFGTSAYKKAFWGQSSIMLNYKDFGFGLSTENLWWGPGIQNSLLMSNSAPGFPHITLNTTRPVKTVIGSFEGQLIGGRLTNSGYPPLLTPQSELYVPKPDNWRYLVGIIITWQPKWVPGLFVGFDQAAQIYGGYGKGITDYLPLFSGKKNSNDPNDLANKKDRLSSVFMRWLWPEENAEVYFEFGRNNNDRSLRQNILEANASRAYIFGLRKLLPLKKHADENILIGAEVTQLQENSITNIRNGKEWYVNPNIPAGYTYMGQLLGAGVGPGANAQTLEVSWVKGLKKIGVQIERYVHNNDYYYYAFEQANEYKHWVDLSLAAKWEWNYKNLIFGGKIQAINSMNYFWNIKPDAVNSFNNGTNTFNLLTQFNVTYTF